MADTKAVHFSLSGFYGFRGRIRIHRLPEKLELLLLVALDDIF